jgi:hypothetical protein
MKKQQTFDFIIDQEEIKLQQIKGIPDPNKMVINGQIVDISKVNLKDLKEA